MKKIIYFIFSFVSLALLLVGGNALAYRFPLRWDFTSEQFYKLTDRGIEEINSLTQPADIYFFYQPLHPSYKKLRDFIKEVKLINPAYLRVEFMDPAKDRARLEMLAKKFNVQTLNTLVIHSNGRSKQISDTELIEDREKETYFKAEEAILNGLISVTQKESDKVLFLSGHGEKEMEDVSQTGLAALNLFFVKNGVASQKFAFHSGLTFPEKTALIVVAGPTQSFKENERDLLQAYVENGGALVILLDPLVQTGLEPLLEKWGMQTTNQIVVDPLTSSPQISAANLFVSNFTSHPAVHGMKGLVTLFVVARPVVPFQNKKIAGWKAFPLAVTTPGGWGENLISTQVYQFDASEDFKGPVCIAVAAESELSRGRVVAVGDSEFVTNSQLGNLGNQEFLSGIVKWVMGRKNMIHLPPKKFTKVQLHLNKQQMRQIFFASIVVLPLLSLGLGLVVWSRRCS